MNDLLVMVLLDSAAWAALSLVVGFTASLLPERLLRSDSVLTRLRPFERDGRLYRKVGVHRWKDRLPEVNTLGPGKRMAKSSLPRRSMVDDLIEETRRAEYTHVAIALCGPLFLAWNPRWLGIVMIVAGIAFNAPCVVIQRHVRGRLLALPSQRRAARPTGPTETATR